jgi:hypothetical protein
MRPPADLTQLQPQQTSVLVIKRLQNDQLHHHLNSLANEAQVATKPIQNHLFGSSPGSAGRRQPRVRRKFILLMTLVQCYMVLRMDVLMLEMSVPAE